MSLADRIAEMAAVVSQQLASSFLAYRPTAGDLSNAWKAARRTIALTPVRENSCVPMTAEFLDQLNQLGTGPIIVVAGALQAVRGQEDRYIFGGEGPMDCNHLFERSDPEWDGHLWLMLGPYIADVSIFRSLRLDTKRPILKAFIGHNFNLNDDALIMRCETVQERGLTYIPRCVLTEAQTRHLVETAGFPEDLAEGQD